jgi:predicted RND superfamily exporter protein
MGTKEAVISAAKSRFRPIVLTSITTVAGLLPLIMETSFQAQFLIPMATSIAFGILFGTVFILLFFPTIILVHNDFRRVWNHVLNHDDYVYKEKLHVTEDGSQISVSIRNEGKAIGRMLIGVLKIIITKIIYLFYFILWPIFVFFPNIILNGTMKFIWGKDGIKDGKAIEPAILNLNEEQERDMEM